MSSQSRLPPSLVSKRLCLPQFRVEDTDAMHRCFSSENTMRFLDQPVHTTLAETEKAIENLPNSDPTHDQSWAVTDAKTDFCLGLVNYHDRHADYQRVSIGYMINPANQGQGIASEAVSTLIAYCFDKLGIHRIQAFVDPENSASRRLVERLGFRNEGLLRDNLRVGEVWRSDLIYALLKSDMAAGF